MPVRRLALFFLTLALVASTAVAANVSSASAFSLAGIGYSGTDTGDLTTVPPTFTDGQTIELYANFDTNIGINDVTFYEETSPNSDDYAAIFTDEANTSGNAYKYDYVVHGERRIFAQVAEGDHAGEVTEVDTLTPSAVAPLNPDDYTEAGVLSTNPTSFTSSQNISVIANFPSGDFLIKLYKETSPGVWSSVAQAQSDSSGNATFANYQVSSTQKLFALTSMFKRTNIATLTPSTPLTAVTLSVERDCTGNDCGTGVGHATAYGAVEAPQAGIPVKLQWQNGSTWTDIGSPVNSDASGKVQIHFTPGSSQWSTRTYRLVAGSKNSISVKYMPGPNQLGPNVLHVDVANGTYPSSTSSEYTGKATLRQNGVDQPGATDIALEKFGVRGSSTAGYAKKPYKLKFVSAPTTVFGMKKDKSWTLLANFLDQSDMRDKVGLDLGRRLNGISWTPDSRYVELFVNDQYVGAYLMTESVKIDDDRVNIDPDSSMIMETDGTGTPSSSVGFKSTLGKIAFIFKDPDTVGPNSDDVNPAKVKAIKDRTNAFETKLYGSSTRNQYADWIDVNSAIDFYLVKEFTKDNDADFYRSNYFWWDRTGDNKFHFGPAWDFDRSAGNVDPDSSGHTYVASPNGWYLRGVGTQSDSGRSNYKTHWWVQLFKTTGLAKFEDAVKARWQVVKSEFAKTYSSDPNVAGSTAAAKSAIGVGAANDRERWKNESKRYKAHTVSGQSGYNGEVAYLTKWYQDRYTFMNNNL
jgi:hypothetical protein